MRLAVTPATIVAIPPPNQRVKPSTCTSSQNPRMPSIPSPLPALAAVRRIRCPTHASARFFLHPASSTRRFPCRLSPHHFRHWLPSGVSGVQLMPVLDFFFTLLPAPEDFLAVELAVEVHQPLLEALEYTADLLQLAQEIVDPPRHLVDAGAQPQLLGRLAPFGPRLRRHQLVLVHQIAPFGMQRHQIGDDALHERQSTIGFAESKVFAGHRN